MAMISSFQLNLLVAGSDQFFKLFQWGITAVFAVDHHHRSQGAATEAVYGLQSELLVCAGFLGLDLEGILNPVQKPRGAAHVTGSAHAYSEEVTALWDETEGFVESGYPVHLT